MLPRKFTAKPNLKYMNENWQGKEGKMVFQLNDVPTKAAVRVKEWVVYQPWYF